MQMSLLRRVLPLTSGFAAVTLFLAGCSAPAPAAAPTAAPQATSGSASAAAAPATASGQPIRIGMSLPLTGPTAYLGESAQKAVQMGMDDWNAKGGINGRKFEL